ncbi:hypothetical protein E2C01_033165 [Portunus trituberculatus]|uniref:Uncharacterized protein n=1 Tax=Portunus trituberculatus TaxID=210409 RepID=A0A5B7F320_PORTR|nr:hypothetical protein [Portunus trituberculatus]
MKGLLTMYSVSVVKGAVVMGSKESRWAASESMCLCTAAYVSPTRYSCSSDGVSKLPIVTIGSLEECVGCAVQLPPISGAGNFIYSGTHIRAHITTQAHLGYNHLEPGYHGDM